MALTIIRRPNETLLDLKDPDEGLFRTNHIFEPEYHQEMYVGVCKRTSELEGASQIGQLETLFERPHRGIQPTYADDENDVTTLEWEGMTLPNGSVIDGDDDKRNVCALKSGSVRFGFIDLELARSVTRQFYNMTKKKAGVQQNDVLINSTGDGTIGRVAVFNYDFPAIVDGHITIVRLSDPDFAWYLAAYLLSEDGQRQIYRYINGSSGQVEIYPQDIERIWIKPASVEVIQDVARTFKSACIQHDEFRRNIKIALGKLS